MTLANIVKSGRNSMRKTKKKCADGHQVNTMNEELWRCTVCGQLHIFYDLGSGSKMETLYYYCHNGCVVPEERIKGKSKFERVYMEGERV